MTHSAPSTARSGPQCEPLHPGTAPSGPGNDIFCHPEQRISCPSKVPSVPHYDALRLPVQLLPTPVRHDSPPCHLTQSISTPSMTHFSLHPVWHISLCTQYDTFRPLVQRFLMGKSVHEHFHIWCKPRGNASDLLSWRYLADLMEQLPHLAYTVITSLFATFFRLMV